MSLTNNLKPSGFQPVGGGELLYKWTESSLTGKTNYRVVLQFNGYTSVLPDFEFRPDASGIIWADVAPILRSLLVFDELVASRMINTYVKYQAKWDESSDAQVNLTGDVIYAYVGNNNYLNYRTNFDVSVGDANANPDLATGVFLSKSEITLFTNRQAYIDFLCDGSLPSDAHVKLYNPNDVVSYDNILVGSAIALKSITITPTSSGVWHFRIKNDADTLTYAQLTINVVDECDNAVYVRWLNNYGGLQHYIFDYNQRIGFDINSNDKAKYIDVAIEGLSFEQFLILDELNKSGLVYNDNYKQGQFVEDVTTYSDPVPLVVSHIELRTFTKRVIHTFRTTFRYPIIPNTDV